MVQYITILIKLFKNIFLIINSNKSKTQAANLPKSEIGNGNDPKVVRSYHQKQQLSIQAQGLSENQLKDMGEMVKVSCSCIIKIMKFKLKIVSF